MLLIHGKTCQKVTHVGSGYLHAANDDRPYDVDSVLYCGRCHSYIVNLPLSTEPRSSPMPSNDDLTERQLVRLTRRDRDELRARCRVLGVPPATRVRMLVLEWLAAQRGISEASTEGA